MRKVQFTDLGRIVYDEAWALQTQLHKGLIAEKLDNRSRLQKGQARLVPLHHLLFCEHHPVFTLGKSGSTEHLLLSPDRLEHQGFTFLKINRGGDITYHGPGQLVGYPIFDLDEFFTDVHRYVRLLEEAIIRTLASYQLEAYREKGYTGVWVGGGQGQAKRKICAIGVHLSRWVTLHGFAFNINNDLTPFDYIVPCGIKEPDRKVTSLAKELGEEVSMQEVKSKVLLHLSDLFDFEYTRLNEKGYSPA